jgi:signal transduction histidine kinase
MAADMVYGNINIIYYAHIPIIIIMLLVGIFVLIKGKQNISAKPLFILNISFALWLIADLFTWVSSNSISIMFYWAILGILESIFLLSSFFLVYTFIYKKYPSLLLNLFLGLFTLPIILLTPTIHNLSGFNFTECIAVDNYFLDYIFIFEIGINLLILIFAIVGILKISKNNRLPSVLLTIGTVIFISIYFISGYLLNYYGEYYYQIYGFIGIVIFTSSLVFLIVKFKAFDIKLLGAQALVWALIITIGSEFFFIQNNTNRVLTAITLVISAITGIMIVRGVKKEITLREHLQIANQNQEALIHFISHQLKGFFTKSKMIFSGLLEGDFGEATPTMVDMAKTGLESDNNAVAMIQDILGASNLKTGTTNYTFKKTNLAEIIKKVSSNFTEIANKKGLKFEIEIPVQIFNIMADETQLSQVFKNLIDNSIKYTPSGEVKVSLRMDLREKGRIIFAIRDTGIGLSESDKKRLFTEGGKGEEALKTNTDSTGYGLYIVKKIVESHNGKIWAESAGRGHGSQFYVELRLVE